MPPKSVFITGCNRGIGLELVKQFLKQENGPTHIFATYRKISDELSEVAKSSPKVHLVEMEVTDYNKFPEVVRQVEAVVGSEGLNCLINNAGVLPKNRDLDSVTPEDMRQAFEVNCVAPLLFTRAMLPLLKKAADLQPGAERSVRRAAAIEMSTAVGSIAENSGGGLYAYRSSKTALNQAMKSLSVDLANTGVLVMSMHPGWVQTEMGAPNALITTETCCSEMLTLLKGLADKDHGAFLRYNNTSIPW
uniref:C-factor n=1 Tax=Pseudodiaptomus poplesia TaxID=213370 RepID=A0A1S6GL55_9MAXI|nr:c-factor [Pseudodiaptomus poplesia]